MNCYCAYFGEKEHPLKTKTKQKSSQYLRTSDF